MRTRTIVQEFVFHLVLVLTIALVTCQHFDEFCDNGTLDTLCEVTTKHNYDVEMRHGMNGQVETNTTYIFTGNGTVHFLCDHKGCGSILCSKENCTVEFSLLGAFVMDNNTSITVVAAGDDRCLVPDNAHHCPKHSAEPGKRHRRVLARRHGRTGQGRRRQWRQLRRIRRAVHGGLLLLRHRPERNHRKPLLRVRVSLLPHS